MVRGPAYATIQIGDAGLTGRQIVRFKGPQLAQSGAGPNLSNITSCSNSAGQNSRRPAAYSINTPVSGRSTLTRRSPGALSSMQSHTLKSAAMKPWRLHALANASRSAVGNVSKFAIESHPKRLGQNLARQPSDGWTDLLLRSNMGISQTKDRRRSRLQRAAPRSESSSAAIDALDTACCKA